MKILSVLALGSLAAFAGPSADAANIVWSGLGADDLASNAANWKLPNNGPSGVPGAGDAAFFRGDNGSSGVIDVDSALSIQRIVFQDSPGAAYTLTGSGSLSLSTTGTGAASRAVFDNGSSVQVITADVSIAAGNVDADGASLTFGKLQFTGDATIVAKEPVTIGSLDADAVVTLQMFPAGNRVITVGDSSSETWLGSVTVLNWSDSTDAIFAAPGGFTAAQLDAISFDGFGPGAAIRASDNELVPVEIIPEPGSLSLAAAGPSCSCVVATADPGFPWCVVPIRRGRPPLGVETPPGVWPLFLTAGVVPGLHSLHGLKP